MMRGSSASMLCQCFGQQCDLAGDSSSTDNVRTDYTPRRPFDVVSFCRRTLNNPCARLSKVVRLWPNNIALGSCVFDVVKCSFSTCVVSRVVF